MLTPKYCLLFAHTKDDKGNIHCVYDQRVSETSILKCLGFSCFKQYLQGLWGNVCITDKYAYFSKPYSGDLIDSINFDLIPVYNEGEK